MPSFEVAAQRKALLDEFERSGFSEMRFAALPGMKYPSFAKWVQRRRRAGGRGESRGQHWDLGDTVAVVGGGSQDRTRPANSKSPEG